MNSEWIKMKYLTVYIIIALLISGCSGSDSTLNDKSALSDSVNLPDSEVLVAQIQLYKKEGMTAEIYSEKIIKFDDEDSTLAYDLNIRILDSIGNVSTNIVGDSGIIRDVMGIVHIYSNVRVVTDDSTTLETEYLWWNSNSNRIKSDAFVRITTEAGDIITGWGLDADNQLKSFKILNQVSGEVADPEKYESNK